MTLLQDIRFAARLLLKDRSFTSTALLTLAICIGANTAIFSIVRSVVLKPLPVPNADRIVMFHNNYPNAGRARPWARRTARAASARCAPRRRSTGWHL